MSDLVGNAEDRFYHDIGLLISPFDNGRPIPLFVQHSVKLSFKLGHKTSSAKGNDHSPESKHF